MTGISQTPQFRNGMKVEHFLDQYFSADFDIVATTPYQERVLCLGDRIFRQGGKQYFIEYKSGIQTHFTGNVFLEIVSVDSPCKPGWVYTCQANYLLYAALLDGVILVFEPDALRRQIAELKTRFRERTTGDQNEYNSHGVVVPLATAKCLASRVIVIETDKTDDPAS